MVSDMCLQDSFIAWRGAPGRCSDGAMTAMGQVSRRFSGVFALDIVVSGDFESLGCNGFVTKLCVFV